MKNNICIIFLLLTLMLASPAAFAQSKSAKTCMIGVRIIGAFKSSATSRADVQMSPALRDLGSQLTKLPFSKYVAAEYAQQMVALREKCVFDLADTNNERQKISVIPHETVEGRVRATVEWQGEGGVSIVSTRMRVENGQNVVLGADDTREQSTIVSIKFSCR